MTKEEMEKRIELLGEEISANEEENYQLENEIEELGNKIAAGEFDPAPVE